MGTFIIILGISALLIIAIEIGYLVYRKLYADFISKKEWLIVLWIFLGALFLLVVSLLLLFLVIK